MNDVLTRVFKFVCSIAALVVLATGLGCTARTVSPETQYDVERVDSLRTELDEMAE